MKEKLLYLVLVLMMTVPLCAQNQNAADYTIKGQVVDSLSNETVPYATLSIALANAPLHSPLAARMRKRLFCARTESK